MTYSRMVRPPGENGVPPAASTSARAASGSRTWKSSPKRPMNRFPCTNAAAMPNIFRSMASGPPGETDANAASVDSGDRGIFSMELPREPRYEARETLVFTARRTNRSV